MNLSHLIGLSNSYHADNTGELANLPRLSILRREALSEIEASIYEPVLCLILQGNKITSVGNQVVELHPGDALLVSHDLPVIRQICDRVGVMRNGKLLEVAETENLFEDPQHEYTKHLLDLMPKFVGFQELTA